MTDIYRVLIRDQHQFAVCLGFKSERKERFTYFGLVDSSMYGISIDLDSENIPMCNRYLYFFCVSYLSLSPQAGLIRRIDHLRSLHSIRFDTRGVKGRVEIRIQLKKWTLTCKAALMVITTVPHIRSRSWLPVQKKDRAEFETVVAASELRLEWVLSHLETYEQRPVIFVPRGAGHIMRSKEMFPHVCSSAVLTL